jgi:hypothetical protein
MQRSHGTVGQPGVVGWTSDKPVLCRPGRSRAARLAKRLGAPLRDGQVGGPEHDFARAMMSAGWPSTSATAVCRARAVAATALLATARAPGKVGAAYRRGQNLSLDGDPGKRTWEEFLAERVR